MAILKRVADGKSEQERTASFHDEDKLEMRLEYQLESKIVDPGMVDVLKAQPVNDALDWLQYNGMRAEAVEDQLKGGRITQARATELLGVPNPQEAAEWLSVNDAIHDRIRTLENNSIITPEEATRYRSLAENDQIRAVDQLKKAEYDDVAGSFETERNLLSDGILIDSTD